MSEGMNSKQKTISKTDVLSSATLTSVTTFILLTWSKNLPETSPLAPYLKEPTIAFLSGLISCVATLVLARVRYRLRMIEHKRDYQDKVELLDKFINDTSCPETLEELNSIRNKLTVDKAKQVASEKR
ncbi:hypothetical protein GCM10011369_26730 [Neiella marina]|uniref:Uncharacterized protein n=1 Tax=Neiella marina TaxID=508461 RepID=A0A8J2U737_9GAMM|nr:hypothetical protein GCM10011369_26730 [Neiella marina]